MTKVVFLDRDNTIIEDKGYTHKIEDLKFLPGAIKGLKKLQDSFTLVIVTNQSGIAKGYYTPKQYLIFRNHMHQQLEAQGIKITAEYFCDHHPEKGVGERKMDCNCRKPKPGMFEKAQIDHDIDFFQSWVVGDKASDIEGGKNIQARTVGILSRESTKAELEYAGADVVFDNLEEAADYILSQ